MVLSIPWGKFPSFLGGLRSLSIVPVVISVPLALVPFAILFTKICKYKYICFLMSEHAFKPVITILVCPPGI
jgi:hypothetical protein